MPYITSVERIGMEKGLEQGRKEGRNEGRQEGRNEGRKEMLIEAIGMDVGLKFPADTLEIMGLVQAIDDVNGLRAALKAIKTAHTATEFRAVLTSAAAPGN